MCFAGWRATALMGWLVTAVATVWAAGDPAGTADTALPRVAIAAPAGWVQPLTAPASADVPSSAGVQYLLLDEQVQTTPARSHYRHLVMRVTDAPGLQEAARVSASYNPRHEQLTLHHIRVHRDGLVLQRLARERVLLLRRERELERRMLDGSVDAHVDIDDLRVGDVVDYAYTVTGTHPVFGNERFGHASLQWSTPVAHQRYRLLWPAGRALALKQVNGAPEPQRRLLGSTEELVWELRQLPGLAVESDAPSWYSPYAALTWSSYRDWAAVANWAHRLYQPPAADRLGTALQHEIRAIAAAHATPRERAQAVLRFVQGQIRYLAVDLGTHSHQPHPPDLVLARRFGDCKDKTLLMITMLQALGIEAHAALVHTRSGQALPQRLPSPGWFDHVIVQLRIDGQTWWLDPTQSLQPSTLNLVYQPDFGHALLLAPDTQALVPMTAAMRINRRLVTRAIDASQGPGQPARLTVTSVMEGAAAERTRDQLAQSPLEELGKRYLNYYAADYPGLQQAAALEVTDEPASNRLTTREHYLINTFWEVPEGTGRAQTSLYSPEVRDQLQAPRETRRAAPLAVSHPVEIVVTTELQLHQPWTGQTADVSVRDAAFEFHGTVSWPTPQQMVVTDRYRSMANHVPAADMDEHLARLADARRQLGYGLAGAVLVTAALGLLAMLYTAWRLYAWDPTPVTAGGAGQAAGPQGLGGWLVLALLTLLVGLYRLGRALQDAWPVYAAESWARLTTPGGAAYHALWAPALYVELLLYMAQILYILLLVLLFFQRRSSLPRLWIAGLVVFPLLWGLSTWLGLSIPAVRQETNTADTIKEFLRAAATALVWGLYFLRSARVRATFTRRRRHGPPAAVTPAAASAAPVTS